MPIALSTQDLLSLLYQYEEIKRRLDEIKDENQLFHVLSCMLIPVLRLGHETPERAVRLFHTTESMGSHLLPVHFYSPIPEVRRVSESAWNSKIPLCLDAAAQLDLLREAFTHAHEFGDYQSSGLIGKYPLDNPAFNISDAALYYCLLRHFRPKRLIEIGCGYSSLIAREACNRQDTRLEGIEPYPYPWLNEGIFDRLQTVPVQNIPADYFQSLEPGDVLFIDSTHSVKFGSDVNYLFLHILPSLKPGVIVHVHDIFLPYEYPRHWLTDKMIFWSEQYLLAAIVQSNRWEVLVANHWLATDHVDAVSNISPSLAKGGGSWWMRKEAPR